MNILIALTVLRNTAVRLHASRKNFHSESNNAAWKISCWDVKFDISPHCRSDQTFNSMHFQPGHIKMQQCLWKTWVREVWVHNGVCQRKLVEGPVTMLLGQLVELQEEMLWRLFLCGLVESDEVKGKSGPEWGVGGDQMS